MAFISTFEADRPARQLGAPRPNNRLHAGVDVSAKTGDLVVSPIAGKCREQSWSGPARAVVCTGKQFTLLAAPATLVADTVGRGQAFARITSYDGEGDATHVHMQAYAIPLRAPLPKSATVWYRHAAAPHGLIHPRHVREVANVAGLSNLFVVIVAGAIIWRLSK